MFATAAHPLRIANLRRVEDRKLPPLRQLAENVVLSQLEALGLAVAVDQDDRQRVHDRFGLDLGFDAFVRIHERDDLIPGVGGPSMPLIDR